MSCSCNGFCNNQECSNHIATCSNSYSFSSYGASSVINAVHVNEFQTAVNGAYTRRGMGFPSWPNFSAAVGNLITAARYTTTKNNINTLHAALVTEVFSVGNIIYASESSALKSDTNTVRNECVCDYNCTCNINCTCNVNCVCDYP